MELRLSGATTSAREKLNKRLTALQTQTEELQRYEKTVHHLADHTIGIGLDNDVKVNYPMFADVLSPIK